VTFTFKKGKHRATPLYWLVWWPLFYNISVIKRRVIFSFSAKYELDNGDQEDVNKLFGLSFGRVHRNSVRFGWNYSPAVKKFFLYSYCYINGKRLFSKLCECVANRQYECSIVVSPKEYIFMVIQKDNNHVLGIEHISKGHRKKISWLLGPYFGGNKSAPSLMKLKLSK